MGARRLLGYGDAVRLLGVDPPGLAALDEALGGALSLATGGASDTVLNLAGAQGRILRVGRDLFGRLRESLGAADRVARTQRLEAAHAVLVVTAYFEALGEAPLPFDWAEVRLTRREQLAVAGAAETDARSFVQAVAGTAPPMPAPHLPYEEVLHEIRGWYGVLQGRLLRFLRGLALWDRLNAAQRSDSTTRLEAVTDRALDRYQELFARLAADIPEFGYWAGGIEHQATRATVRTALSAVESLLGGLAAAAPPVDVAAALTTGYRAALGRRILAEGEVPADVGLPTVADSYLDPLFRVRATDGTAGTPAEEGWWSEAPLRTDLCEYLAGALTGPGATSAPVVVLGQPGAGKSMLTKVLAARLHTAGFLPVRVVLREIPAEADVQDQIEYAVRSATGERVSWPELIRAAPGAVPLVLFDGFDELLQATGVSQSDFLLRIAAFQQRESDQGRPVIALVTTRTAVADRARYPDGAVALRLEPFSDEQVRAWVRIWNRTNESRFAATGTRPLPEALAEHHRDLATQPLLLLMLALYDATGNALQRGDTPLNEADLYEDLLTAFAAREIGKSAGAAPAGDVAARVRQELERLSLVAFAMLNRRRQWVTASELDDDLNALLGRPAAAESRFHAALGSGEVVLGRFFFIQRAQAVQDGRRLATYEFLHATFGEYLAVRLAVDLFHRLIHQRPGLLVGPAPVDDDLLYALLSYVPLSARQMLRFVRARVGRIPEADRQRLCELVVQVIAGNTVRTQHAHMDYRPDPRRPTSSRNGTFEANLLLVLLALTGGFTGSRIFPDSPDTAATWHRRALLWRSAMNEEEWTEFALSLRLRHVRVAGRRELEIRAAADPAPAPEPVDPAWLYGYVPVAPVAAWGWRRAYWGDLLHKMEVSAGTNDSVVRHTLEPVVEFLGPELMTFYGRSDAHASSIVHDLLRLWLTSRMASSWRPLAAAYRQCAEWLAHPWAARVTPLVLDLLAADADRLPPDVVADLLTPLQGLLAVDQDVPAPILVAAVAALAGRPSPPARQDLLVVARSAARYFTADDAAGWEAWLAVHDHGLAGAVLGNLAAERLRTCDLDALPPVLQHRIRRVVAVDYPEITL